MIVYCCADLIFATKVRATADAAGIITRPVRDVAMLRARLDRVDDGKPNEPVRALLLDLETGDAGLALIDEIKAAGAGVRVVAFGSHVETAALAAAKARGADTVMTRGGFTARLPDLLRELDAAVGA